MCVCVLCVFCVCVSVSYVCLRVVTDCVSVSQAVFMYWIPNNFLSLAQTRALKTPPLKRYFNIPEPPPADPFAAPDEGALAKIKKVRDD